MKYKVVLDKELGEIYFPKNDEQISYAIQNNGIHEENEINWIKKNVKEGDICINVGANVGYHSMFLSKLVGESGKVFSFEPSSSVFPFFKMNIYSKKIKNIYPIKSAAGNFNGEIFIYINNKNFGDNRCFNPTILNSECQDHDFGFLDSNIEVELVKIKKIDDLFKNKKIDIMVIDTQGYDLLVLDGSRNVIENNFPKIIIEFTPEWNNFLNIDYKDIFNWIILLGYRIYNLDNDLEDITNKIFKKIEDTDFFLNLCLEKKNDT